MIQLSVSLVYKIYTSSLYVVVTKYLNGDKWHLLKKYDY